MTPHGNIDSKDFITFFQTFYEEYKYICSDLLFYLFAALVAYYVSFLLEIVNRRAFLDHRRCVESKFKLNFEKDQQEQLLGSCLPKHLMRKVRSDIRERFILHFESNENKSSFSRPFTELYIEKYKDVTILYADIVNSMLLTQSLESPKVLVETLNGLFGRFDSRAEVSLSFN
jgi:adenylate cyclase